MRAPHPSFWRHSASILRRSWGRDASRGMVPTEPETGQTVVCTVQERSQDTRPVRVDRDDSTEARRLFDVLIPVVHPVTGESQFPEADYPDGPAILIDDVVVWLGRRLRVAIDVDPGGRGGRGHVLTAYCEEIV